ncbi:uncharacterized protein Z519_08521 [Cladophialophora bantiana CBS 173.52]|uniref:Yeast cell wall synthesis Kre9/Knh1-like N-terminal domain-containing protein n=1 Tax=Cladophialophora bantiana (strain ATCC 10958 / CBS 173.52 / CDC B-1940 / NIH 8579) TaxID=1442370 RepID=A0A0D2HBU2_CLAB1|nr:uncharacterized protein Z519_08521 [Cladophialophora bantiana CBS 173.52]KIW90738.1 hypothetical protein Z519_08521 [Cladophialophora bantiana CBS 173.52]
MPSLVASLLAAGLATLAQAYTAPGEQTWGPLLTPDLSNPVTQGEDFTVTWDPEDHPTDGVTVSLVLCHGPSTNCVLQDTAIASGIPAAQKSFDWKVPCDLAPGTKNTDTGYGMLIIVDGTGEFQYSTQFSCLKSDSCSSSSSSSPVLSFSASTSVSGTSTVSGGSIILGPPAYQTGTNTWGSSGNSTWATTATKTGSSWATATASSGSFTYSGGYSTLPGTTVIASSTLATATAATTAAGQSSGAASAPAASASTFAGGAGQVGYSAAGLVIAGAVAVLAL